MGEKHNKLADTIKTYFKQKHHRLGVVEVKFIDEAYAYSTCKVSFESSLGLDDVISFANMKWLSNLLKTDKIDSETFHYDGHCDTCDHGARDTGALICKEINPFGE